MTCTSATSECPWLSVRLSILNGMELIDLLLDGPEWMNRAACGDEDPELFAPPSPDTWTPHQLAAARAVCQRCPVRLACLAHADQTRPTGAVWGGELR